jgi:DNA replication licensing factor MCM3
MEQQTVTIAKAGMHASLNARCSVVAAANPVYGQYDRTRRPQDNIGLPDSLLSRFDLLFIVLDLIDPALDRRLSEHVIRSHQYRRAGTSMEPEPLNQTASMSLLADGDSAGADGAKDTVVWQKGGRGSSSSVGDGRAGDVLTKEFLRKYLHFAKSQFRPVLSDSAMDSISTAYSGMRAKQTPKNVPVTARSLETIIRLASAHAKVRLSTVVEDQDVEVAVELMNFVLFHEVGVTAAETPAAKPSAVTGVATKKTKRDEEGGTSGDDEEEADFGTMSKKSRIDETLLDELPTSEAPARDNPRYIKVQSTISKLSQSSGLDQVSVDVLMTRLNARGELAPGQASFKSEEVVGILLDLEKQNKVNWLRHANSISKCMFADHVCGWRYSYFVV